VQASGPVHLAKIVFIKLVASFVKCLEALGNLNSVTVLL